jgi:alkylation response protein AidB-like acyl-CoA dehydrogenase
MTTRAELPVADLAPILHTLARLPELQRLRDIQSRFAIAEDALIQTIIEEADRLASKVIAPLNADGEHNPPRYQEGRVRTSDMHKDAWNHYAAGGWLSLDMDPDFDGQGLPLVLAVAVQEVFDRASPAFGMLPVPMRSAARMISMFGDDDSRARWLPRLASGEIGATICISEVEAGSDVARLRTVAEPAGDRWRITGEKQWISFGDHDLTETILHCVLARDAEAGGFSLFLVPCGPNEAGKTVVTRRLEEKLGLHLSPTCALGFEGALGERLGAPGRGMATIFGMITRMRLAVGAMGLGIAVSALDVAQAYSAERRQGGKAAQPVRIDTHPDVQRMLKRMSATVTAFRNLLYTVAAHAELAEFEPDKETAATSQQLVQWLLPVIKTLGGEIAFDCASEAIQVLGGAGYTADWPIEQALRDARVLTIFEGTTGIQAADLVQRGIWRGGSAGLGVFLKLIRDDLGLMVPDDRYLVEAALEILKQATQLVTPQDRGSEAASVAYLHLVAHCALAWAAIRQKSSGAVNEAESEALDIDLGTLRARCDLEAARIATLTEHYRTADRQTESA